MEPLTIVAATAAGGTRLSRLVEDAVRLSVAAGTPSVIVLHGRRARSAQPADYGPARLVVQPAPGGAGDALLAGVRLATASRCLLAEDRLRLDARVVLEHRRPRGRWEDLVTVGDTVPRLPYGRPAPPDGALECVFALQRARHCCLPRAALGMLGEDETLDDPVAVYRLAQRLREAGMRFARVETPAAPGERGRRARGRGAAATRLYAHDAATLPASGLGDFGRLPAGRLVLRRMLAAVPGAARALETLARASPAPGLRHELARVGADGLFWRGARAGLDGGVTWRRLTSRVTVLMYHAFACDGESASRHVLPARRLDRQLTALRALRRQVMPLEAYVRLRRAHGLAPARTVVVTIDDGYADVYEVAAPVLAAHACQATVFVVSDLVGGRARWPPADGRDDGPLHGRRLADWQQIRDGARAGLDVGAHTRSHPPLTRLRAAAAAEEIAGSRRDIGERLGRPVTLFAYPHGDEDGRTRRLVAEAGFAAACTSRGGSNVPCEPLHALRRVEVRGDERLWRFVASVVLGRRIRTAAERRPEARA